jgi:hypothetical protein
MIIIMIIYTSTRITTRAVYFTFTQKVYCYYWYSL